MYNDEAAVKTTRQLRTRTGCLTCRDRRKKCDEQRPVCYGCDRNVLQCRWRPGMKSKNARKPTSVKHSSRLTERSSSDLRGTHYRIDPNGCSGTESDPTVVRKARPRLLPATTIVFKPPGVKSTAVYSLLAYYMDNVQPLMTRPHAHAGYGKLSYQFRIALHQPIAMDILLACASTHLEATSSKTSFQAGQYYSSAIRGLQRGIAMGEIKGSEDWLVMVTLYLGIFERWQNTYQSQAPLHLFGAFQVLKVRLARAETQTDLMFNRCLAENLLYHLSILSLFHGTSLYQGSLLDAMQDLLTAKPFPDCPQWANSPLLGGFCSLFRLIYEITQLRCMAYQKHNALILAQRLSSQDHIIRNGVLSAYNQDKKSNCFNELRLFSSAAKVLLTKILHPERQANHPSFQQLVHDGIDQLRSWQSANRFDQLFCWPLLIIGCAITHNEDIELVRLRLGEAWKISRCGDARRVMRILEHAWELPVEAHGEAAAALEWNRTTGSRLDILLHKEGVFQLDSISANDP